MSTMPEPERVDLAELAADIDENYPRRVLLGAALDGDGDANPLRAFGPGTTAGGRAEAGWFDLGTIADNGLTFTPDRDR